MNKKHLVILCMMLITCTLFGCTTQKKNPIGEESTYTTVNNFENAQLSIVEGSVTPESITLEFTYSGENELYTGERYYIEIMKDDKWHAIEDCLPENSIVPDIAYTAENGRPLIKEYDFTKKYYPLSKGQYRIVVDVSEHDGTIGPDKEYILATEFEIK